MSWGDPSPKDGQDLDVGNGSFIALSLSLYHSVPAQAFYTI